MSKRLLRSTSTSALVAPYPLTSRGLQRPVSTSPLVALPPHVPHVQASSTSGVYLCFDCALSPHATMSMRLLRSTSTSALVAPSCPSVFKDRCLPLPCLSLPRLAGTTAPSLFLPNRSDVFTQSPRQLKRVLKSSLKPVCVVEAKGKPPHN